MSDGHSEEPRVRIGTPIIGADGKRIGEVDGVVLNPVNDRVRLIVMRKGLLFHSDQSFGVQSITKVDDEGVHVSFTRDDADVMDHWMDQDYLTPPDGYFAGSGVFWVARQTREMGEMNVEERDMESSDSSLGRQERLVELNQGMEVVDRDGENLGRIGDLAADAAGRISAFRVDQGRFRQSERWVPLPLVARTTDDRVVLTLTTAELDECLERQGSIDPSEGFVIDRDE